MTDPRHTSDLPPAASAAKDAEAGCRINSPTIFQSGASSAAEPALGEPKPVNELTPEEQMARFEKELKEKDWGHQPC